MKVLHVHTNANPPGATVPRDVLEVATEAARSAGAELLERYGRPPRGVGAKQGPTDLVSDADRAAEAAIAAVLAAAVIGEEFVGRPGVADWDPLRIVIDVRGTGCTGYEVAAALRGHYDIHVELATHATMVLILGLDEPVHALERFAHDFAQTVRRIERPGEAPALVRGSGWFDNEVVVPPREAFLGPADAVPVDQAPGRVSAESIAGYPPGIPALLPGERITSELVEYLRELRDAGARLHGASDPSFATICVLRA